MTNHQTQRQKSGERATGGLPTEGDSVSRSGAGKVAADLDLDAMSAVVGAPVSRADVEQVTASLDTLNLDELVAPVVRVAIMERTPHPFEMPDGTTATRYTLQQRVAEITLFANVDTQLKALALNRTRRNANVEEQIPQMLALLLEVWQQSEPDMTLERLKNGLDLFRISKLFQLCFTPPSRM